MPYDKVLQETIQFSDIEENTVKLEDFQRLRFIKQNGFAYLLYPDAINNRFDHSIGTMYWATHLYNSVKDKQDSIDVEELQAIRLSALVHDIGHGPFSHTIETLFDRRPSLFNYQPWNEMRNKFGDKEPHELLTLSFVNSKKFIELIPSRIIKKVNKILTNRSPLSLLISGDLDADRLDYLLRDSYYSGLPFGLNVKPIFNQLMQLNIRIIQRDHGYFLEIDSRAIPAFEQLLMARYAHYFYIAYEPRILTANLIFLKELERSLWKNIKGEDRIALAIFYMFTELTDNKLLDLDFSSLDKGKIKLLEMINTESTSKTFESLKNLKLDSISTFIKLPYLGKKSTYDFFKLGTTGIEELETIVSGLINQSVNMHLCIPKALTMRTCVSDENISKRYSPALAYDYSPFVRSLEQKMYLDCGLIVYEQVSRQKLLNAFSKIESQKTDFDVYAYAIYKYITRVPEYFSQGQHKWKLRRSSVFEFLHFLNEAFFKDGKVDKKIDFETYWYCEDFYELLQKLEFLDFLDEDFNISEGDGFIPCYIYSIGEYGEELLSTLKLTDGEKKEIELFIERYIRGKIP